MTTRSRPAPPPPPPPPSSPRFPGLSGGCLLGLLLAVLLLVGGPAGPAHADFLQRVDYTLTNQSGADFHGQDLAETSFAGAVARRAVFAAADLHGAILTAGDFAGADFRGADLSEALIDRVDFRDADFRGALLHGVIASGSSFAGADVTDADFTDAILDRADQVALCREATGSHPVTGVETRLSLGCG
ncbi:MAG: pentapeptide repeat-containing protein [Synechococcaceae cyanobacterium]|nr:pentapeptide repeat-containing protein [Synechococcaceae cyanobacterium]